MILSNTLLYDVTSTTYQLKYEVGTLGNIRTTLTDINSDIAALSAANKEKFQVLIEPNTVGSMLIRAIITDINSIPGVNTEEIQLIFSETMGIPINFRVNIT